MDTADPSSTPFRPYVIVAGTDFSEDSKLALLESWQLATQRRDAELHVCHVADPPRGLTKAHAIQEREHRLGTLPATLRTHVIQLAQSMRMPPLHRPLGVHVRIGKPAEQLLQLAVDLDASLIVVGSHGRSALDRLVMGSTSDKLVRAGRLPVLVSRPKSFEGMVASEQLEPPCPDCIDVRRASGGDQWWCEIHARPRVTTHVHSSTQRVDFTKPPMDFEGIRVR